MLERSATSISISKQMNEFYELNGIVTDRPACPHLNDCRKIAKSRELICCSQAHIGTKYGEEIRIVVVSLDTGEDAYDLERRTEVMEEIRYVEKPCKQTKGTMELLFDLLGTKGILIDNVLKYTSMTNSAKCSGVGSKNKLSTRIYQNCSKYQIEELELLQPDVIYTQGVDSMRYLRRYFTENEIPSAGKINDFICKNELNETDVCFGILNSSVKLVKIANKPVVVVECPHPSARDGRWRVFKKEKMNIINRFISSTYNVVNIGT